jgi:hypothetical protein
MITTTPSLQISRLRGIDAARSGVSKANPAEMRLLARSLAHEVVDHMEVNQLSEGGSACDRVADAWGRAAASLDRDATVSEVVREITQLTGMNPASGLQALGFGAWDDLVREALGLEEGVHTEGVDMLAQMVCDEAEVLMDSRAIEAIPEHAMVEMSFVPGWDGRSKDEAVDSLGLSYSSRNCGLRTVQCGPEFAQMLRFFNVSIAELLAVVKDLRPDEYDAFADRVVSMEGWQGLYHVDADRPSLMSAEGLLTVLENASQHALPNISFSVRLKSLLAIDPSRPIRLDCPGNRYHVGCHDGMVNGAGYMDTFEATGQVSIDLSAGALIGESRWNSSLSDVYWHNRSAYRVGISQPSEGQAEVSRLLERVGA